MSLSMPKENSLWHARIGIFNLNRTYITKIKVPRLPLTNYHFSVHFFFIRTSKISLRLIVLIFLSFPASCS